MNLNTDHLKRCIETLQSSVTLYGQSEAGSVEQEVFRNAIVKGYELVQETSFKLLRKALRDFGHGARQLDATTVKDLLRLAATHGLLTLDAVERWFVYRDNRNNTAHDYGEGFAKETLVLLPGFIADVIILEEKLSTHFSGRQSNA
jgi:hypothetical protein